MVYFYSFKQRKIHAKSIIAVRLPSVHSFELPSRKEGNGEALCMRAVNFILSHELLSVTLCASLKLIRVSQVLMQVIPVLFR
jgi:hypothetical protein